MILALLHSQEIEFWHVSVEEVQVDQGVLGRGAWGYVSRGTFRGQQVAVKKVYPDILEPHTMGHICREISTMAQVHHSNLVLFIAAVLDDRTGPMIITRYLTQAYAQLTRRTGRAPTSFRSFEMWLQL